MNTTEQIFQIPENATIGSDYNYEIEASTAGLRPGVWPEYVIFHDQFFRRGYADVAHGEIISICYTNAHTVLCNGVMTILKIWND